MPSNVNVRPRQADVLGFGVAAAESTASGAALEPKHSVVHSLHPRHFLGDLLHGRAHLLLRLDILVDAPDMAVQEQMLAAGGCAATTDATSHALTTPSQPTSQPARTRGEGENMGEACSPVEARVLAESELLIVKALDALLEALLDHPAGRAPAHVSTRCARPVHTCGAFAPVVHVAEGGDLVLGVGNCLLLLCLGKPHFCLSRLRTPRSAPDRANAPTGVRVEGEPEITSRAFPALKENLPQIAVFLKKRFGL